MLPSRPPLSGSLPEGHSREMIEGIHAIYADAAEALSAFQAASGLRCPVGCRGACCRGFEPELSEAEALYLAAWIIETGIEPHRASSPDGRAQCPFWEGEATGMCSVYPGRALICRLFGFSAMRGSRGETRFNLCRSMERRDIAPLLAARPPLMADFGLRVEALSPGRGCLPMGAAVDAALMKLRYVLESLPASVPGGGPVEAVAPAPEGVEDSGPEAA